MKHVLIVDDSKEVRFFLSRLFVDQGLKVSVAENGLQGIKAYENERPDMVFSDINMPEMGGVEFAKYIFEHYKTKVTLITATPIKELPKSYFDITGVNEILHKSYFIEEISSIINTFIKNSNAIKI